MPRPIVTPTNGDRAQHERVDSAASAGPHRATALMELSGVECHEVVQPMEVLRACFQRPLTSLYCYLRLSLGVEPEVALHRARSDANRMNIRR